MEYKKNLEDILSKANESEVIYSRTWYKEARLFCFGLSVKYGVSFKKVCAIVSALSPRNKWERNKQDAETFIRWKKGEEVLASFATYGNMVDKAEKIYESEVDSKKEMLRLLNGPKIKNFFLNIYDTENNSVTVDSWIFLAATGNYIPVKERKGLTASEFNEIATVIKELALERNESAPETQALIWLTFKRLVEDKVA